jgi:putative hydrolase of the HAD superfamily
VDAAEVSVVLFDLDGVVRSFPDNAHLSAIWSVAFEPGLLDQAVTGKITDEEWRTEIARRLGDEGHEELAAWNASCGEVNPNVIELVRMVRRRVPVGILTNGTTRLSEDLARLGIAEEFDRIFNSCDLGVAKPALEVFRLVCGQLDALPASVLFVDDSPNHVDGARRAGMQASLFVDAVILAEELRSVGVID